MSDVQLDSFDEESINFTVTGRTALQIACLIGDPFGYTVNRAKALVTITLFGEDLTRENCTENSQRPGERPPAGCEADLFSQIAGWTWSEDAGRTGEAGAPAGKSAG